MNIKSELIHIAKLIMASPPMPIIYNDKTQQFVDHLLSWINSLQSGTPTTKAEIAENSRKLNNLLEKPGNSPSTDSPLSNAFPFVNHKELKKLLFQDFEKPFFRTTMGPPDQSPKDYLIEKTGSIPSIDERNRYLDFIQQVETNAKLWRNFKKYIFDTAKSFAVSRQQIKEQKETTQKQQFTKTISRGSMQKVHKTLQVITEVVHPNYVAYMSNWLLDHANTFINDLSSKSWLNKLNQSRQNEALKSNRKFRPTTYTLSNYIEMHNAPSELHKMLQITSQRAPDSFYGEDEVISVSLTPNAQNIAHNFAEEQFNIVADNYLHKNVDKLTLIIENKEKQSISLLDIKTLHIEKTHGATFSSETLFTFADNSSFKVINKAVGVYNTNHTWFYRYPTTFHDVHFSDGSTKAMVPEEYMISNFASKTTIASELIKIAKLINTYNKPLKVISTFGNLINELAQEYDPNFNIKKLPLSTLNKIHDLILINKSAKILLFQQPYFDSLNKSYNVFINIFPVTNTKDLWNPSISRLVLTHNLSKSHTASNEIIIKNIEVSYEHADEWIMTIVHINLENKIDEPTIKNWLKIEKNWYYNIETKLPTKTPEIEIDGDIINYPNPRKLGLSYADELNINNKTIEIIWSSR